MKVLLFLAFVLMSLNVKSQNCPTFIGQFRIDSTTTQDIIKIMGSNPDNISDDVSGLNSTFCEFKIDSNKESYSQPINVSFDKRYRTFKISNYTIGLFKFNELVLYFFNNKLIYIRFKLDDNDGLENVYIQKYGQPTKSNRDIQGDCSPLHDDFFEHKTFSKGNFSLDYVQYLSYDSNCESTVDTWWSLSDVTSFNKFYDNNEKAKDLYTNYINAKKAKSQGAGF